MRWPPPSASAWAVDEVLSVRNVAKILRCRQDGLRAAVLLGEGNDTARRLVDLIREVLHQLGVWIGRVDAIFEVTDDGVEVIEEFVGGDVPEPSKVIHMFRRTDVALGDLG